MATKISNKKKRKKNKEKTIGYLRVSTDKQDLNNQRLEILEYARKNDIKIDDFIAVEISSRKSTKMRRIDELLEKLNERDTLLVTDLSRLGRSVGQIIQIVDSLLQKKVKFLSIKESIRFSGTQDIQTKTMITMFGLFAEIERDLISMRTKQGLAAAKEKGKLLGRPRGKGKSKLDPFRSEIEELLKNGSSKVHIAKKYETSLPNLYSWFNQNNIPYMKRPKQKTTQVTLWMRVENNNKFGRGKKKARGEIERYCLQYYDMKKSSEDSWEYELTIPHRTPEELDEKVYELLAEIESRAGKRNCFSETNVREIEGGRSW